MALCKRSRAGDSCTGGGQDGTARRAARISFSGVAGAPLSKKEQLTELFCGRDATGACGGASEGWLGPAARGARHARNLA